MNKHVLILANFLLLINLFGKCIGQNSNRTKSSLVIQIEQIEKENDSLKRALKDKTAELESLKGKANNPNAEEKYPSEIDKILNIEDTTIFSGHIQQYDIKSVHPRSREMYLWVCKIQELEMQLRSVEKHHRVIEDLNSNLLELAPSTRKQLESSYANIKESIRQAQNIRKELNPSIDNMRQCFTSAQMNYYNNLVCKLNNFINLYFE